MRTVVLVNRRARGLARRGPILDLLVQKRPDVRVDETGSLEELDGAVRELAADPPDVVLLAGGDGSYMAGVTVLTAVWRRLERPLDTLPIIALGPGGTAGTVARNWGLRGDPVRYGGRLFDALSTEFRTARRPTLSVTDPTATRIGFIVGSGLVTRFFEEYEARGARGYGDAARIVGRIFAGSFLRGRLARRVLTPMHCAMTVDGVPAPFDRVSLVCASVVRDLGLHMRLLYRAAEQEDAFHIVGTPLGPAALGPQMPRVLAGLSLLGRRVDVLARDVTLAFSRDDGAYVLDGDLFRADMVRITAGPVIRVVDL